MSGAQIIPLPGASEADAAWAAYIALCNAEKSDPALLTDRAHVEARVAAHVRFCELYAREHRKDNVVPIDGGRE